MTATQLCTLVSERRRGDRPRLQLAPGDGIQQEPTDVGNDAFAPSWNAW